MVQIIFSENKKYIADLMANGAHPGRKVVSDTWDSNIICPSLRCLDNDLTEDEVIHAIRQNMTSLSSLDTVSTYFSIEVSSLPVDLEGELAANGRCTVTESQLLSCVQWTPGFDEDSLIPDDPS
jgi:hypothetical protein